MKSYTTTAGRLASSLTGPAQGLSFATIACREKRLSGVYRAKYRATGIVLVFGARYAVKLYAREPSKASLAVAEEVGASSVLN